MNRRAFTLIELLAIVAIIAVMVTGAVVSYGSGQGAAKVKAATRDIFAVIRHARSTALITQKPSVITYSTTTLDGQVAIKVDVVTAKLVSDKGAFTAKTLQGETVVVGGDAVEDEPRTKSHTVNGEDAVVDDGGGQTMEDILFAPISSDVVRGMRIKVVKGEEVAGITTDERRQKPKISVFSNVDYILGTLRDARQKEAEKKSAEESDGGGFAAASEDQAPVDVLWQVNGRTEAHRLWIYPDGSTPDKGLSIVVDKFGAAKVIDAEADE